MCWRSVRYQIEEAEPETGSWQPKGRGGMVFRASNVVFTD